MNTNSYFTRNDDTWGITPSTVLALTLSLVLGTKSLLAQSPISSSNRLPIEVISGESPFAENSQWQQLSGGHAGCEGAQWEIRNDMLTLMYAAHHDQLAYRWTEANGLTVWRDDSPEATSFRPDGKGGYYVVEQTTRQLARWDADGKRVAILADRLKVLDSQLQLQIMEVRDRVMCCCYSLAKGLMKNLLLSHFEI